MNGMDLREKDSLVLNQIVESYLSEGKPVSSDFVTHRGILKDSPATIRNIMVKLEELGYLFKPHPSAGRVPTDKGLRFYVNRLMETVRSTKDVRRFSEGLSIGRGDFHSLLARVSQILSEESNNLGFVISPRVSKIAFNHLRFIKVAENKVMIIILTTFNLILNEIVETSQYFTQPELDEASDFINTSFRGKNLIFVREYLLRELPRYRQRYEAVANRLISLLRNYFLQEDQNDSIFFQGTSRLLAQAGEFNLEKLKLLFRDFEEKARLAHLISDVISLDPVKVLIGSEVEIPDIADCTLIVSHYGSPTQVLGSLGIIGPKRIPYKKIIPLVDTIAQGLSQRISQTH
jgi:heat-inducible transcriptional repressor